MEAGHVKNNVKVTALPTLKKTRNGLKNLEASNENAYEELILRTIEYLASKDQQAISSYDLISSIGEHGDQFVAKRWLLTLEGRGLIRRSKAGLVLTQKGRARLQNKI